MLIEFQQLQLTLEVAHEYEYDDNELAQVLYFIECEVEKGTNNHKRLIDSISRSLDKKIYKSKTAIDMIYNAYLKDLTALIKGNQMILINDHILKYDMSIEQLLIDPTIQNPQFFKKRKIDNFMSCLDAMYQKEKLLGLHKKSFRVVLNNKIKQQRLMDTNVAQQIDMSILTIDEKIELNNLLEKASGVLTEDSITYIDETPMVETVEAEVITIETPMPMIKQTNVEKLKQAPVNNPTVDGVKSSLFNKFKEMAQKQFDEKGIGKGAKLLNPRKDD